MDETIKPTPPPDVAARYARQIILPQIGPAGQAKIAASSVLLIGMGGLGSPVALYLAAAGVGRLILVDDDKVALSNLQRQVIYRQTDIGRAKIDAAAEHLRALNPNLRLDLCPTMLTEKNAASLVEMADIVADGSDNLATRYLVNDSCHQARKPLVAAAVTAFDGQLTVIRSYEGDNPCYRCLFPASPDAPSDIFANCSGLGVLGPAAGVMGSLQAVEIIKQILGIGESLVGRLVIYDALAARLHTIHYAKTPGCRCDI
ncbi:MAG: HesA/MoeB/ThiF family protein [Candidatus Symbiobacter sp.]|nr:HesA/MoeB/ThiF family protein [Candidatus Symbiobacter sp.]